MSIVRRTRPLSQCWVVITLLSVCVTSGPTRFHKEGYENRVLKVIGNKLKLNREVNWDDTPPLIAEAIHSSALILKKMTATASSPFSAKVDEDEEEKLNNATASLSTKELRSKLMNCVSLADTMLREYVEHFADVFKEAAEKNGMRLTDVVKIALHGMWVTCTQNLADDSGPSYDDIEPSSVFLRTEDTPHRFSRTQYLAFEAASNELLGSKSPGRYWFSGWFGHLYFAIAIGAMVAVTAWAYNTLRRAEDRRKGGKSGKTLKDSKKLSRSCEKKRA